MLDQHAYRCLNVMHASVNKLTRQYNAREHTSAAHIRMQEQQSS